MYYIFFVLFFASNIKPITVGSTTSVSRGGPFVFPSGEKNLAYGFYSLEGGITLQDQACSCSVDLLVPIQGPIALNGGYLFLSGNTTLGSGSYFASFGSLEGDNTALSLNPSLTLLQKNFQHPVYALALMTTFGSTITSIDWDITGNYLFVSTNNNSLAEEIFVLQATSTTLTVTNKEEIGRDVLCIKGDPYVSRFAAGLTSGSQELRHYDFTTPPNTVSLIQGIDITGDQTVSSLSFHPTGSWAVVGFIASAATPSLQLYQCNPSGIFIPLSSVTFTTSRNVATNALSWEAAGQYLAVGTAASGNSEGEILIYYFNGTTLTLTAQYNIEQTVSSLAWSPTGSFIAAGVAGGTGPLHLYKHQVQDGTLNKIDTSSLFVSGTVSALSWHTDGTTLLAAVANSSGSSFINRYHFFESTQSFSLVDHLFVPTTSINGLAFKKDYSGYAFSSSNTVYVMTNGGNLSPSYLSSATTFTIKNLSIIAPSSFYTDLSLYFEGECAIYGNGSTIELAPEAMWKVADNSVLTLENIFVKNVSQNKVCCSSLTSTIKYKNVSFLLDSFYSFTVGNIQVEKGFSIVGPHTFSYESDGFFTLSSHSFVSFYDGTTFRYAPQGAFANRVVMTDKTSGIFLTQCSLSSSSTSLLLTKGSLYIDGVVKVYNEGIVPAQGIQAGDGNSSNNLSIIYRPGARLQLEQGYFSLAQTA